MKRYFDDLDTLHRFTLALDSQPHPIRCRHCAKQGQFVSHGFVYKKHHQGERRTVGKRLFCSNRHGRSGCGRTVRLYLDTQIARLQYTVVHLTVFLLALLAGHSTQHAYQLATQTTDPRNAWRWLNKLNRKLIDFRAMIHNHRPAAWRSPSASPQHGVLLATLQHLFSRFGKSACRHYQQQTQTAFV